VNGLNRKKGATKTSVNMFRMLVVNGADLFRSHSMVKKDDGNLGETEKVTNKATHSTQSWMKGRTFFSEENETLKDCLFSGT
jgi:hypothetical protein